MDLVEQPYWDNSYKKFGYYIENDAVIKWLVNHGEIFEKKGSLFEFGCFPGRYMAYFGKKGWKVNGMDLTPRIEEDFVSWLNSQQIISGIIKKGDALAYASTTSDQYDLVCSFGFIEHFQNFLELIDLHHRILKPGGFLVISTPNFRGEIQNFLHKNLDSQNLGRHFLPAMQPNLWRRRIKSYGYKIVFSGYFGGFDFWCDEQKRNSIQTISVKALFKIKTVLKNLPSFATYAPYCGIIAQKT